MIDTESPAVSLSRLLRGGPLGRDGRFQVTTMTRGAWPVADYLADTLDQLIHTELLALARPDPAGAQQVCITHAGQIRYAELNSKGVREAHRGGG